jgi:hypothetical protein
MPVVITDALQTGAQDMYVTFQKSDPATYCIKIVGEKEGGSQRKE